MNSRTIRCSQVQFREQPIETEENVQAAKADFLAKHPENIFFGIGGLNVKGMVWHFLNNELNKAKFGRDNLLQANLLLGMPEELGAKIPLFFSARTDNKYYESRMLLDFHDLGIRGRQPTLDDIPTEIIEQFCNKFLMHIFNKVTANLP